MENTIQLPEKLETDFAGPVKQASWLGPDGVIRTIVNTAINVHDFLGRTQSPVVYEFMLESMLMEHGYEVGHKTSILDGKKLKLFKSLIVVEDSVVLDIYSSYEKNDHTRESMGKYILKNNFRVGIMMNFSVMDIEKSVDIIVNEFVRPWQAEESGYLPMLHAA